MPPSPAADDVEALALAEQLRAPLLRLTRRMRQEASPDGLSPQDVVFLANIAAAPGVGVCDLADIEQISRPTMSHHVKRLETAGWIVREDHAADGRRQGLHLTPAATSELEAVRRRRTDWLATRLARLPEPSRRALAQAAGPLLELMAIEA